MWESSALTRATTRSAIASTNASMDGFSIVVLISRPIGAYQSKVKAATNGFPAGSQCGRDAITGLHRSAVSGPDNAPGSSRLPRSSNLRTQRPRAANVPGGMLGTGGEGQPSPNVDGFCACRAEQDCIAMVTIEGAEICVRAPPGSNTDRYEGPRGSSPAHEDTSFRVLFPFSWDCSVLGRPDFGLLRERSWNRRSSVSSL